MKLIEWAITMPALREAISLEIDDFIPQCNKCPVRKKCDEKFKNKATECYKNILELLEEDIDE